MEQEKKTYWKGFGIGVLSTIAAVLVIVIGGNLLFGAMTKTEVLDHESKEKISLLSSLIEEYYYDEVSVEDLQNGIYHGLVQGTKDPYTVYYTPEEYQELMLDTSGSYAGIGATLTQNANTKEIFIVNVYEDSPAKEGGLRTDDQIISVDGDEVGDTELSQYVKKIRGEPGTKVEICYLRDGKEEKTVITRREIKVPTVTCKMLTQEIGYVKITEFSENTKTQFDEAMSKLQEQGVKKIIFDLRYNGGGLLDSVTEILDEILPEGVTVYMEDKKGERTEFTSDEEHAFDYPMVVLTSQYTASAAEIFAGAIRDFNYGTLIGTNTFGKGIVQTTLPLTDGSAIKVTTHTYYTPSGECIHKKGIAPDIELELEYLGDEAADYDEMKDNQVLKGIEVLSQEAN